MILTLVFFGGTFGVGFALTLFLQFGLGFTAIHAGLTAAPYALGSSLGALSGAGLLAPRLGRNTLQLGNALQAVGLTATLLVLARTGMHVTTWNLAAPLLLWGLGMGLVIAPLFDFVLSSLAEDEAGSGSGMLNALQQLGCAIGVAAIGTVYFATPRHIGGFEHSLHVGLGITAAVFLLTFLLPRHVRETPDPSQDQREPAAIHA